MVGGAKPNPDGDTKVMFVDRVSEALGMAPHPPSPVDTTFLDTNSRHAVYEFITELGNEAELHHTLGKEKLDLMQVCASAQNQRLKWVPVGVKGQPGSPLCTQRCTKFSCCHPWF